MFCGCRYTHIFAFFQSRDNNTDTGALYWYWLENSILVLNSETSALYRYQNLKKCVIHWHRSVGILYQGGLDNDMGSYIDTKMGERNEDLVSKLPYLEDI